LKLLFSPIWPAEVIAKKLSSMSGSVCFAIEPDLMEVIQGGGTIFQLIIDAGL